LSYYSTKQVSNYFNQVVDFGCFLKEIILESIQIDYLFGKILL